MQGDAANPLLPVEGERLRLVAPTPLPGVRANRARTRAEAYAIAHLRARGFRLKEARPRLDSGPRPIDPQPRSINASPVILALLITCAAGAGLWQWRIAPRKAKAVTIESPLDYHKRQFLVALRGDASNAVPMQIRVDRMRFHQRALLSHGFLAEKKFVFTNGGAANARLAVNRIEGVSMEYAVVEPRGRDALVVIAPQDDMPVWESVMRIAGAK